jgi:signal transduction histidine kinase
MRLPKLGFSHVGKMFTLFFVAFALVQALVYFLSAKLFPYQIIIESRGWVSQTTFMVFVDMVAAAACAAVLCVIYVRHTTGPLQRLTEEIKAMESRGEFVQIKIRSGDKLFGLVEAINNLFAKYLKK